MDAKQELIKLVAEAHSNEIALTRVLDSHVELAERGSSYRSLLDDHRRETKEHARKLERRLERLGHRRTVFATGYGMVQNLVKQTLVMTKAPIDMLRGGTDTKQKALRNAIDEAMTEGLEIGAYDAIEALARSIGDHETAELAASIRIDEERMFQGLRKEIPGLAERFIQAHVDDRSATHEPWPGYDEMTVEQIEEELREASVDVVESVRRYEEAHKSRSTVVAAAER